MVISRTLLHGLLVNYLGFSPFLSRLLKKEKFCLLVFVCRNVLKCFVNSVYFAECFFNYDVKSNNRENEGVVRNIRKDLSRSKGVHL